MIEIEIDIREVILEPESGKKAAKKGNDINLDIWRTYNLCFFRSLTSTSTSISTIPDHGEASKPTACLIDPGLYISHRMD